MSRQNKEDKHLFGFWDLFPFLLFVLALAFFAGAILSTYSQDKTAKVAQGAMFNIPELSLASLNNPDDQINIGGEMDAPVIINFFASWCAPCKVEHPLLMELGRTTDTRFVGIAFNEDRQDTIEFLDNLGNPYSQVGVDSRAAAAANFSMQGIPATFILNKSGQMVFRHDGPLTSLEEIRAVLDNMQ